MGDEQHEAAIADRSKCSIAIVETTDHRRINEIKNILRDHAGDNRQGEGQNTIEALLVQHRGEDSVCVRHGDTGKALPGLCRARAILPESGRRCDCRKWRSSAAFEVIASLNKRAGRNAGSG